jgi:hypothetical protein
MPAVTSTEGAKEPQGGGLREALRAARIDAAEKTGLVIELRDAEVARLELLNETLDPVFQDIPADIELFDRGISRGETPRLWIDAVAYVVMGHDKRLYRFVQDTRHGRKVLAESSQIPDLTQAITRYVAGRLIERERMLAGDGEAAAPSTRQPVPPTKRRFRWGRLLAAFLLGAVAGGFALFMMVALIIMR